jgi:hypothetical protein
MPQAVCGADWTSRLEGMFQDISLCTDMAHAYKDAIRKGVLPPAPNSVDLFVNVWLRMPEAL